MTLLYAPRIGRSAKSHNSLEKGDIKYHDAVFVICCGFATIRTTSILSHRHV